MTKTTAIDPPGCGCTDCIVGESVPLDAATEKQIRKMLRGKLADRAGGCWTLTKRVEFAIPRYGEPDLIRAWKEDR